MRSTLSQSRSIARAITPRATMVFPRPTSSATRKRIVASESWVEPARDIIDSAALEVFERSPTLLPRRSVAAQASIRSLSSRIGAECVPQLDEVLRHHVCSVVIGDLLKAFHEAAYRFEAVVTLR